MLLPRAIIRNLAPDIDQVLEPHDSFCIGSDVFYTYIVDNGFWDLRVRQRTEEGYFALAEHLILMETRRASIGLSRKTKLDRIVYVDPVAYYNLPYADKPEIAALIGQINWQYREQGKHMMLMVPGRIGTSSPELGVPTSFSDISSFEAICEIAESRAGYI